jgi:hypothetical protein
MGLDIRVPIGLMFAILGALLSVYGIITSGDEMYAQRSLGLNMNLWWGLVMLAFGLVFLWIARRGAPTTRPTSESPEGRALEEAEARRGLEKH